MEQKTSLKTMKETLDDLQTELEVDSFDLGTFTLNYDQLLTELAFAFDEMSEAEASTTSTATIVLVVLLGLALVGNAIQLILLCRTRG